MLNFFYKRVCFLYTSDAVDEGYSVGLGGVRGR